MQRKQQAFVLLTPDVGAGYVVRVQVSGAHVYVDRWENIAQGYTPAPAALWQHFPLEAGDLIPVRGAQDCAKGLRPVTGVKSHA